jgi:hypothetical protein
MNVPLQELDIVDDPLTGMEIVVGKPVIMAAIVATVSIAALLVVNHTNLIADRRPPQSPPGTTFNTVNSAGAGHPFPAGSSDQANAAGPNACAAGQFRQLATLLRGLRWPTAKPVSIGQAPWQTGD